MDFNPLLSLERSFTLPTPMLPADTYNLEDDIPSPVNEAYEQLLQSPNPTLTPPGSLPCSENGGSSPPSLIIAGETSLPIDFAFLSGTSERSAGTYLGDTVPQHNTLDTLLMNLSEGSLLPDVDATDVASADAEDDKLHIVAEPNAFYRERYLCESDPRKNRAQRFIRSGNKNSKYEYPTVKFSAKWYDPTREFYIRVTPVTIKTEQRPYHCIHPYRIDTQDSDVFKDPQTNSLYFLLNSSDFSICEKRFLINRIKMVQTELKKYGPFCVYNTNQPDDRYVHDPRNAKEIIATYQLWKSQLVFTMTEYVDPKQYPVPMVHTEVISQIMTDMETEERQSANNHTSLSRILCAPQKADWRGGELVLLVMPQPIKQKVYTITFDFQHWGHVHATDVTPVDRKTLSFRVPPCPVSLTDGQAQVPMIVGENGTDIAMIEFTYVAAAQTSMSMCSRCAQWFPLVNTSNKRARRTDASITEDSVNGLMSQMKQLTLIQDKARVATRPEKVPSDNDSKLDEYLNHLKDAVAFYVRTNDPSRLLRRTRCLLSQCDDNPLPLHEGIEQGHIPLALLVIEQVAGMRPPNDVLAKKNEQGETVLLVGARCKAWEVVEMIVKKRGDLVVDRDVDGNNVLHILASVNEDTGAQTIEKTLAIISEETQTDLLREENKAGETPAQLAELRGNTRCLELLA